MKLLALALLLCALAAAAGPAAACAPRDAAQGALRAGDPPSAVRSIVAANADAACGRLDRTMTRRYAALALFNQARGAIRAGATGAEIAVLEGHSSTVTSVAFSPDGARLATASWDDTARLWDVGGARAAP